jgi:glyoxylase-like metal-dependent hydrolase (beta-lactamase superfamily II)
MNKTLLYQLTETSKFMMSFVLVTQNNNVIIIDGGRKEDMPLLKKYVAGRHVSAWILTHAHGDHMWGFMSELKRNNLADFDVEKVIYNFPPYNELKGKTDVPDPKYFDVELEEALADFVKYKHICFVLHFYIRSKTWEKLQKKLYSLIFRSC